MPAILQAVSPPPLSTGVPYDTGMWAEVSVPLDPATVNDHTVFLKLDTGRVPITVQWDGAARRIMITPLEDMELFRTYTVELSSGIHLASGEAFDGYFWQFKTNSVRRLRTPMPTDGAVNRSPFTALMWDSTEAAAGSIRYDVYVGSDSAAVANRSSAPAFSTVRAWHLPTSRWTAGARYWWSVSVRNLTTSESLDGPTWSFSVISDSAPRDSVALPVQQWGLVTHIPGVGDFDICLGQSLNCGSNYTCAADWDLANLPSGARIVDARLTLTLNGSYDLSSTSLTIWGTDAAWTACDMGYPGPPYQDLYLDALASGISLGNGKVRYASDLFAADLQARLDGFPLHGYLLRSTRTVAFWSPAAGNLGPVMLVEYVTDPAGVLP